MAFRPSDSIHSPELLAQAHRAVPEPWRPFLQRHGNTLARSNFGWELRFFNEVLSRVPSLRPEHVTPQHPFQDMKGGRRFIDFAVRIGERRLAVEVDGFDKAGTGGPTPESHVEFTERQNALSLQGWAVFLCLKGRAGQEECGRDLSLADKNRGEHHAPQLVEAVHCTPL